MQFGLSFWAKQTKVKTEEKHLLNAGSDCKQLYLANRKAIMLNGVNQSIGITQKLLQQLIDVTKCEVKLDRLCHLRAL